MQARTGEKELLAEVDAGNLRKRIEMAGKSGFFEMMSRGVNQLADNAGEASPLASGVRRLAGRSATAAKEIKDLIQDSVKKVEDGSVLVAHSGQRLEQIVSPVHAAIIPNPSGAKRWHAFWPWTTRPRCGRWSASR